MYKTQLYPLGFSEKEAEVYIALNTYGPSPAATLARLTNIKRTSMYDILSGLLSKNLIITSKRGSTTFYAIDDLNKLLHQERQKVRIAENVVSQMTAEQATQGGIPVNHYIGEENYREMYEDILRADPKELMAWINLDEFYGALDPVQEENWTKQRVKQKIYARLLLADTPLAREFRMHDPECYRTTILVPQEFPFGANCFIYDNHVLLFDARDNITGIRINHAGIYRLHKQIFEMNWQLFN